jgi:hypothetical protein
MPESRESRGGRGDAGTPREALLERLGTPPGLCADCRHLELVSSPRSVFARCGRSRTEPAFPRYPALPVRSCAGFEPMTPEGGGEP